MSIEKAVSTEKRCNMYLNANSHQGRMDFGHGNVDEDRLSSLPDDLIHKILSFTCIKHAIRMSVLSSRWRSIWTSMPYLNFSNQDFSPEFVSNVLHHRENNSQVSSVKLVSWGPNFRKILDYSFSHNVQQLTVTCNLETNNYLGIPLFLFRSRSLKHLTLSGSLSESLTWDLPALTTLHLNNVTLPDKCMALFYKCTNLKNLSIHRCRMIETNVLYIFHPRLSNLTLQHTNLWVKVFKVFTLELKNLTITNCDGKHLIYAPGLTSLVIKGCHPLELSNYTKGFPSFEKADLCISRPCWEDAHKIVCLLQQLHNVKFLTLNLEILELFHSSSVELISHQPSPFTNLKILKFLTSSPARVYLEVQAHKNVTTSTEIKNNLLDSFQSVISTMISCEEIRVMRYIASAQQLVTKLQVLLQQSKALINTNKAHMGQADAPMESCKTQVNNQWTQSALEMQWHFGKTMTQIYQRKIEGSLMKQLHRIEGLLTEPPVSKSTVVMQTTFSSVCEEADIVTNNMVGSRKIRYNKKPRRLNV